MFLAKACQHVKYLCICHRLKQLKNAINVHKCSVCKATASEPSTGKFLSKFLCYYNAEIPQKKACKSPILGNCRVVLHRFSTCADGTAFFVMDAFNAHMLFACSLDFIGLMH